MSRSGKRGGKRQADWRRKEAQIRELMAGDRFILSSHVYDKIACNFWTFDDVVASIETGAIQKAQREPDAVDERKYTILGVDCFGNGLETVGKIVESKDGRLYFVITCY